MTLSETLSYRHVSSLPMLLIAGYAAAGGERLLPSTPAAVNFLRVQ